MYSFNLADVGQQTMLNMRLDEEAPFLPVNKVHTVLIYEAGEGV